MKGNERKRTFMLITIPVLILFFTFNTLPLIKGFIYSFTNFKGYGSYEWVGLRNYIDLFQDARVGKSYLFTFKFAIVANDHCQCDKSDPCTWSEQQDPCKKCTPWNLFYPECSRRTCCRLYFQFYFHIYSPDDRRKPGNRISQKQYACEHKVSMVCNRNCCSMAGNRHEHDHLYLRSADRSGGCL